MNPVEPSSALTMINVINQDIHSMEFWVFVCKGHYTVYTTTNIDLGYIRENVVFILSREIALKILYLYKTHVFYIIQYIQYWINYYGHIKLMFVLLIGTQLLTVLLEINNDICKLSDITYQL